MYRESRPLLSVPCLGVGMFLRSIRTCYTVRISPDRLHLTTRGILFSSIAQIPAHELEELQIAEAEGRDDPTGKSKIVARSDRTTAEFGGHLPPKEKVWIKAVVEHVLTA